MNSLSRFLDKDTIDTVILIVIDIFMTLLLLAGLSVIHFVLDHTSASDEFKSKFTKMHEFVVLGMYLLLAIKGMVRLIFFGWPKMLGKWIKNE